MNELEELGLKYGTDKIGKHNYLSVYYDLFKDKRNEVKKVLEIGVGEGAGLFMFRDFFPNATIYGAEIDPRRVASLQGQGRIEVFEVNQASQDDLINLINQTDGDIDLVIDDGSHDPADQVYTCLQIFPALNKGSIYVIEDVADSTIVEKLSRYNPKLVRVGKRYDDQIIICQK